MEVVGGRGQVAHRHVALGAELQIPLQPGRGMLRPLTLMAMRQQQRQAGHAQPLGLTAGEELVDDHLRAVGEVAELRFPQHQRVRVGQRVAVFEAQHAHFGQQRVEDLDLGLIGRDVVQRHIFVLVGLVDQHRVALAERAALAILTGQPHAMPVQ